ncbi:MULTISPECIES: GNAT family N-acetyltransferase [unclassified Siphonobacter]|uniref:GNAT family N-acetyltransferase n=1 Tax=unclassified Siphonobacter TaxID=2635712 RepID=UPI000CABCA5E|nr:MULTISPECIES: GNAT family N-acetyltransferase [unclassified Siphonobacter]MDQ1086252.1 ribosomal-protein-alanine N-acetyltransferase [Siphonobacter sp. SORGH_AS_1065]MDR6196535.1 ribosomal-protein-alanine N-acetyltransferase [Siphonobacter sp. SORGH_AS_0500]PKK35837.1 GNAT family N-acetyltransferase [Siphonobacter sp. SORGH_AS_0500]
MIETSRLRLLPCDLNLWEAVLAGNNVLSQVIGANVPRRWTENASAFAQFYQQVKKDPSLEKWGGHLIVYRPDNLLIGSCGYKGQPNEKGEVEIGYEIKASHREKGLATETANALVDYAFTFPEVHLIVAHTLTEENSSTKVLTKVGFKKIGEVEHAQDGIMWRWELSR